MMRLTQGISISFGIQSQDDDNDDSYDQEYLESKEWSQNGIKKQVS